MTRKELRAQRDGGSRTRWYVLGAAVVVLVGVVLALVLGHGSAAKKAAATTTTTPAPVPAVHLPPDRARRHPAGRCRPVRRWPSRSATTRRTGRRPASTRPTWSSRSRWRARYTRLVAVFQCQGSTLVGDLRSARQPDVAILSQLSNPIFLHAGGIDPVLALLSDAPLQDENILKGGYGSVTIHPSGRYAPYSTFTSTGPAWALGPGGHHAARPDLHLLGRPAGRRGRRVGGQPSTCRSPPRPTSPGRGTPPRRTYLRSYSGVPDKLLDGSQTAATNVVVLTVPTFTGPWLENSEGGYEVEVTATGTGPAVVLRNGVAITGTWTRSSPHPAGHADGPPAGRTITLQPGNTWEELAPQGVARDHHGGTGGPAPPPRPGPDRPARPTDGGGRRRPVGRSVRRGVERPAQEVERGDGRVLADPVAVTRAR